MKKKSLLWSGGGILLALLFSTSLYAADVGYDKGFFIKSDDGDYKLKTNIQLQPQYQYVSIEGQDEVHGVQLRKARIAFSGNAFDPNLSYKFQFEAYSGRPTTATEADGATGPNLRDAYLDYEHNDAIGIQVGQFKTAHNREELTSSSNLQFVDRSINNEVFTYGRSLGINIHGGFFEKQLEYSLFIANDANIRNATNANNEMLLGAKVLWNALGEHGYTMSDISGHEDHTLTFGLGVGIDFPLAAAADDPTLISPTFDLAYMYNGFSFVGEMNYLRNQTASTNTLGFLGQMGYFLVPEHFEVALRGAGVIPTAAAVANGYEAGVGLNYFFKGHNLKLQTDYNVLINSPLVFGATNGATNIQVTGGAPGFVQNQNDHRVRTQVQLYF